ncbi:MAG: DNA repair protein RecO [Xanthomonadales bacterium]|nr:DNA repair protein RecO [Xanthomonadales bacterium]
MHVDAEPALILHARAYRETSLLLECLTRSHGRIGLIARGVRRERSRLPRGLLQPLQPLLLGWTGRGELMTMTQAEACAAPFSFVGERIYSAMYLNELVLRLCARGDPHSDLFDHYVQCLNRLSSAQPEAWSLRRFERDLLIALGYGLVLDREIESGQALQASAEYAYVIDGGPRAWSGNPGDLRVSGAALLALATDEMPSSRHMAELRRLMRALLQHQLGGGSLNAWTMRMSPAARE